MSSIKRIKRLTYNDIVAELKRQEAALTNLDPTVLIHGVACEIGVRVSEGTVSKPKKVIVYLDKRRGFPINSKSDKALGPGEAAAILDRYQRQDREAAKKAGWSTDNIAAYLYSNNTEFFHGTTLADPKPVADEVPDTPEDVTPGITTTLPAGPRSKDENFARVDDLRKAVSLIKSLAELLETTKKELSNDVADLSAQIAVFEELVKGAPREIVVKVPGKDELNNVGRQHKDFERVLKSMAARVNTALVGPAGSGKTTCVSKAAAALGLNFYSKSVSAQTGAHEFFGYQDANGNYVRTLFRDAYEFGGVFLLDEFDAGNPNVLAALNQAVANSHCAFADGMVRAHKDFVCVAAGNTYGNGATLEYVGRNPIDGATLDRFAFINFGYDERLEAALASNKNWCKCVQILRKAASDKGIRQIISPRATFMGEKLLAAGVAITDVLEMTVLKGMSLDERNLLKQFIQDALKSF